ncbi:MAG: hypothetical protein ACJA09_000432 [Alcanivorax sp.]|jgi:hypothetical protein
MVPSRVWKYPRSSLLNVRSERNQLLFFLSVVLFAMENSTALLCQAEIIAGCRVAA